MIYHCNYEKEPGVRCDFKVPADWIGVVLVSDHIKEHGPFARLFDPKTCYTKEDS